jgi:hypothetical protein
MIDYAPIQAWGKEEAPTASRQGGASSGHSPECVTSVYCLPSADEDSHNRRCTTSRARPLAPF